MAGIASTEFGVEKEHALRQAAQSWSVPTDSSQIPPASEEEVPLLDVSRFLEFDAQDRSEERLAALQAAASRLKACAEGTGFHLLQGHGVPSRVTSEVFQAAAGFHALPDEYKATLSNSLQRNKGCGYLPEGHRKLPARDRSNINAAYIVKRMLLGDHEHVANLSLHDMPWPDEQLHPSVKGFQGAIERYCAEMECLALKLLPLYAVALGMEEDWFTDSFASPLFRLRLNRYPATPQGEFGINPHVDTSFITILLADQPGLVVENRRANQWVRAPHQDGAFLVNFGEILAQVSNDTWPATRHYALHTPRSESATSCTQKFRYSIPFFFNATCDIKLSVAPSCISPSRPARYEPISYIEGQGIVQGE